MELKKLRIEFDRIIRSYIMASDMNNHLWNWVKEHSSKISNLVGNRVSQPEPNQQLFTIAEIESFLERQKEICKQQYNLYCTDRELPISDVCRKMILEAPAPNIVKS